MSHVVARRADKPLLDVTREEHRQTWTRFHHVHLPKLADAGLIRRSDGRVSAASSPVLDRPEFDALVRRDDGETDDESDDRDAILSAQQTVGVGRCCRSCGRPDGSNSPRSRAGSRRGRTTRPAARPTSESSRFWPDSATLTPRNWPRPG
ncbi:hypothetical protein [Halorussus caseinilyticus]|uniref:ArsR family transcriptional regulator n=1 Tax=Halorussus caseinilyticus TaxID=3034025 RepID=A0ABD5WSC8_9EURY